MIVGLEKLRWRTRRSQNSLVQLGAGAPFTPGPERLQGQSPGEPRPGAGAPGFDRPESKTRIGLVSGGQFRRAYGGRRFQYGRALRGPLPAVACSGPTPSAETSFPFRPSKKLS